MREIDAAHRLGKNELDLKCQKITIALPKNFWLDRKPVATCNCTK
jgi:hypothetical protein